MKKNKKRYDSPQLYLVNEGGYSSRIRILYPDGKSEVLWQKDGERDYPSEFSCFSVELRNYFDENWYTSGRSIDPMTNDFRHKFMSLKQVEKAAKKYDKKYGIKTIFIDNL